MPSLNTVLPKPCNSCLVGHSSKITFLAKEWLLFVASRALKEHTFAIVLWFGFFTWLPRACSSQFSIGVLYFNALFPPSDLTLVFCQLCSVAAVAELQLLRVLVFKLICGHWRAEGARGWTGQGCEPAWKLLQEKTNCTLLTLVEGGRRWTISQLGYFPLLLFQVLSKICSQEHIKWNVFLSPQPQ